VKVEIWSDVACPFCYIGKRNFENGLSEFARADGADEPVEVVWRSFQLSPDMPSDIEGNMHKFLADLKGISYEDAMALNDRVTQMGAESGLEYNFDIARPANTFDAHRLTQLADEQGLRADMIERLFEAYFAHGANLNDRDVLADLAADVGIDRAQASATLAADTFAAAVIADRAEATELGIHAVPFFVIDRRFGFSGAQSPDAFASALKQASEAD
jgi:predicted DsbA family dithiol-disulfide isomerase